VHDGAAASENARHANSVFFSAVDSSGASEDRTGEQKQLTGSYVVQVCWRRWRKHLERQRRHLARDSLLHWHSQWGNGATGCKTAPLPSSVNMWAM